MAFTLIFPRAFIFPFNSSICLRISGREEKSSFLSSFSRCSSSFSACACTRNKSLSRSESRAEISSLVWNRFFCCFETASFSSEILRILSSNRLLSSLLVWICSCISLILASFSSIARLESFFPSSREESSSFNFCISPFTRFSFSLVNASCWSKAAHSKCRLDK